MKLEVGKKYRMRNGGVATVERVRSQFYCPEAGCWYLEGGTYGYNGESEYDLIAPLTDADGWIEHKLGDPCPVDGDTSIDIKNFYGQEVLSGPFPAEACGWRAVSAYRIHKPEERGAENPGVAQETIAGRITLPAKPYIDPEINAIISVLMLPDEQRKRVIEYLRGRV